MLGISEQDTLQSLERDNPWWVSRSPSAISDFTKRRAYFESFAELALNWDVRRTVILMGPRRVGKTVMLHQLIGDAVDSGFSPDAILYASLDTPLYSGLPLERLLELFEKITNHDPPSRRIVIFDEVQYLKDWEVHLKVLTDRHPDTRFIASGSAAAALRLKSQESGAGRFTDFLLPPLTFAEFLDFSDLEEKLILSEGMGEDIQYQTTDIGKLNAEFINYLNFGGYPEAVLIPEIRKNPQRYLGRDIIDKVLLRDLPSLYGIQNVPELNRLFTMIAYHSGHEISLDNLASSSGVAKNTISRYLEYLEAAFLIVRVRRVDDSGKTFQRARQFKAHLTNPSMRMALFAPLKDGDQAMGAMAETAIFSQWFHADDVRNIHYARWKSGRQDREVDLVYLHPSGRKPAWAVEIKWSDRFIDQPGELRGLIEFAKRNDLDQLSVRATTKSKTSQSVVDGVTIEHLPCALYCYRVGRNVVRLKTELEDM